ncbi:hypothetical protein C7M84_024443 [Penaeus vannamei]|uniref:Uncharacterized protein n=1 Tax=Penaeus vannamei TaxID=6689 RepID=A0A3R7PD40_PENVA|nr:hypothetical protein C7M84_024443 [Penaeus vannamei]
MPSTLFQAPIPILHTLIRPYFRPQSHSPHPHQTLFQAPIPILHTLIRPYFRPQSPFSTPSLDPISGPNPHSPHPPPYFRPQSPFSTPFRPYFRSDPISGPNPHSPHLLRPYFRPQSPFSTPSLDPISGWTLFPNPHSPHPLPSAPIPILHTLLFQPQSPFSTPHLFQAQSHSPHLISIRLAFSTPSSYFRTLIDPISGPHPHSSDPGTLFHPIPILHTLLRPYFRPQSPFSTPSLDPISGPNPHSSGIPILHTLLRPQAQSPFSTLLRPYFRPFSTPFRPYSGPNPHSFAAGPIPILHTLLRPYFRDPISPHILRPYFRPQSPFSSMFSLSRPPSHRRRVLLAGRGRALVPDLQQYGEGRERQGLVQPVPRVPTGGLLRPRVHGRPQGVLRQRW